METFNKLFGSLLSLVYHCFDRMVILAYLPLLARPANVVHLYRDVNGIWPITPEALRKRTDEYRRKVEELIQREGIPAAWAEKGASKEDQVLPWLRRMERRGQHGVYYVFRSMEIGTTFRSSQPKHPTEDPGWRLLSRHRSRHTHFYFYIRDEVLGPITLCVSSFLPFHVTCWLNGHNWIEGRLLEQGVAFRKNDNSFLAAQDPKALQEAADSLTPEIIKKRLNRWIARVGPDFSSRERRCIALGRAFSIQQVEYCRNFVFRRNHPIHKLFERSCDLGLARLAADKIAQIFGFRVNRRLRGKLRAVLDRIDHGHHVLRAGCKNAVVRMYEKHATFLRVEALSNHLGDFRLKKSLDGLEEVRKTLSAVTDRFAAFEAEALNVHVDFPLFQRLALAVTQKKTRIPGIKIQDTRMVRLMEVLLHAGAGVAGWSSAEIHRAALQAFGLDPAGYTIGQLRYDLRKMKAHGLLERVGKQYRYRLTDKGVRVCLMFTLFHKRVCGPLADSLFNGAPNPDFKPATKLEAAYRRTDRSLQRLIELLAA